MKTILNLVLVLSVSGCAVLDNQAGPDQPPVYDESNSFQSVERHPLASAEGRTARVGFIEFDDLGFQKSPGAVSNVFEKLHDLNESSPNGPLLLVVFIHGWHHDARPDDSNVVAFKNFLKNLQYEEDEISFSARKRQVVGVYIGWRGESNDSVLNHLTYRTRKLAGLRVGQYGLQEILAELNKIRNSNGNNRLVSIGHSFGGGVLYSSVMQNLVDSVVNAQREEQQRLGLVDKAYGDLVVLMNPALEAARVEVLNRRLSGVEFAPCQPLVLASFTSEYDKALGDAFPLGQKLFFYGDAKAAVDDSLVTTPYGNAAAFRTHELSCASCDYDADQEFLTRDQFIEAMSSWGAFRKNRGSRFRVGNLTLSHIEGAAINPGSPLMNVHVRGDNIIRDHNAIWGAEFAMFARAMIGMEFAAGRECR